MSDAIVLVLVLLLASIDARAEGWSVALGAGPALHREPLSLSPVGGAAPGRNDFTFGASMRLDTGYRIIDPAAVGMHLGIAYVRAFEYSFVQGAWVDGTYVPFEIGVGAQLVIGDRVFFAPWTGFVDLGGRRFGAVGAEVGLDLFVRDHDRVSGVLTCTWAPGTDQVSYLSIGGGVAYRYW